MKNNKELIQKLKTDGTLRSKEIERVLLKVNRKKFVPEGQKEFAYFDNALLVAEGQTISQPTTVVIMLELLNVKKGQKVLDIGAGSGWVSCLLGELVGLKGGVRAFEINETVGKFGLEKIKEHGTKNVKYEIVDATEKWSIVCRDEALPRLYDANLFDRIYAGAAFKEIPKKLLGQLKIGGILVAPLQDGNMVKVTKQAKNDYNEERYFGFAFVPFVDAGDTP